MKRTQRRWLARLGVAAILAAFAIGVSLRGNAPEHPEHTAGAEQASVWTCSMHPQIQLPDPGACPLCGMDLIPLDPSGSDSGGPRSLALSPNAAAIAGIQTTPVEQRAVESTLRMVGKLEADEGRIREIAARVAGRIDHMYIDYTGESVRAGQKLFDLYSPELYSAQEELLQSIRASEALGQSGLESTRRSATRTVDAVRERLRLWGLTAAQIQAIESRGAASEHVTIVAPISGTVLHKNATEGSYLQTGAHVYVIADLSVLWLKLDVYESDIALIALGQRVHFTTDTYPGEEFEGVVTFVDPVLDPRSRSVKTRVEVANDAGRLKPGMFARAVVHVEVGADDGGPPIVIPKSAPLVTGTRAIVYVADPGTPGTYEGREVVLGREAGDVVVVREGLEVGERVVSNGSFKIDSALQLLAKPSMMNPEGGGPPPDHAHGTGAESVEPVDIDAGPIAGIPQAFRVQLDDVLAVYFELSTALSQDDLDAAKRAARDLPDAVNRPDHSLLPAAGHAPWGRAQAELTAAADVIASSMNIASARLAFFDMSESMIRAARRFRTSGATPVLVYHCPMAMDGTGADWLQAKEGTENPYYGSMMFRCGSRTETLAAEGSN